MTCADWLSAAVKAFDADELDGRVLVGEAVQIVGEARAAEAL
ncbi:hypothetical protein ACFVYT_19645 [Streptomyces sp. NPDC058290]